MRLTPVNRRAGRHASSRLVVCVLVVSSMTPAGASAETSPTAAMVSERAVTNKHLDALGIPISGGSSERARTGCAARELALGVSAKRGELTPTERDVLATTMSLVAPKRTVDGLNVSVACQIGYFVRDGQVLRVFPVSTGKRGLRTATGTFKVSWKVNGWRESSSYPGSMLYRPLYFHGGQAVHGMKSDRMVYPYPASHGCVRTHRADVDWLWKHWRSSDRIRVYGSW